MFLYQTGAFAGSAAKAETSSRGRFISISVRTSTATCGVCHQDRLRTINIIEAAGKRGRTPLHRRIFPAATLIWPSVR
jgi:hypothetical protein